MGKKLVIVILAVLVSCGAFVALAGEDLGRLREAFRNASAGKKAEVRKLLRKELPDLQSGVLSMLERKYPALPARAGRIIVQEIDRKYPALASELPEKILKELEKEGFSPAKHAGVILDLLGSKYPDLPAEILSARKAQHVPVKMLSLICTKYPGFRRSPGAHERQVPGPSPEPPEGPERPSGRPLPGPGRHDAL